MKAVIATLNAGKASEIKRLLEGAGVELVALGDLPCVEMPIETGDTFEENALIKARRVAGACSMPAIADDSGIEVDALGGRPGVYSARYSGRDATDRDNCLKLLSELEGVPTEKRGARFRCVAAFVEPGGAEATFSGSLEGFITERPSGTGGFGYDPVFLVPGVGRTVAEMTPEEKNRISHRAEAFGRLRAWLSLRSKCALGSA
jgi:XTP/dITP diphosphohydrolase